MLEVAKGCLQKAYFYFNHSGELPPKNKFPQGYV